MSARPILAAGALVAGVGAAVLFGWLFDVTPAKSVMAGWRVMVPATAACFVFAGVAIILSARAHVVASRGLALIGLSLPLLTFIEYLTGIRTGLEGWFGVAFDMSSPVAGRMSPLTSLCFTVLDMSLVAHTLPRPRAPFDVAQGSAERSRGALVIARLAAGSTLLTAWLAIIAVAFDSGRLADVPRFPGMAVMTIALMAIASWASLALSFERDPDPLTRRAAASPRLGALLIVAFTVPLLLGLLRDATATRLGPQVVTAVLVLLLAAATAAIIWQYAARMAALRGERERAFAELEERVIERTRELAARNEELKRTEDRLREDDRRKDEFLATLAHELRNPLAPIRSAVAALRSDLVSDEDKHEARVIIERQVGQMSRLIDDLLDISRITAGKLPMKKSPLALNSVLNLAISTVRPHIDEARHRLIVSMLNEPVAVDGDEARLSQVFANLLHNACKYTEPGGEIMITASLPTEHEVEIAVRDNGIGIPPEFLPRLFEKFSQVAPALDRSQGGLGLGLSLVHGIVALHDGRVEARSAGPGRGSEFVIRLPVLRGVTVDGTITMPPPASHFLVSRRVLVVDDNADSAESLALLLRIEGHLVETAYDGYRAVELAERFQPDAILLDLGMPGMNGYDVCEQIRSQPWGESVLMVAQTGWGQAQDRARTLEAGFDAHLTKPIDPAAVQEMLVTLKVHS
ncbi:MAG TPA: ATP-binding protein [Vicinamibacterales bacterium]|nr:ATP-binding protein [Vicinamibacterales bacterium]